MENVTLIKDCLGYSFIAKLSFTEMESFAKSKYYIVSWAFF